MRYAKTIELVALILLIIAGLNLGLIALFHFDLVHMVFGSLPIIERVFYILVGVSALYYIYLLLTKAK